MTARPRGHERKKVGGPGIEPGPARYQRAVPPRTPASERKLRQQGSNLRFASNSRASCRSTTPERNAKRKERESNPRGPKAHPFSRRDTAPTAVLPRGGSGRRRTCTPPIKSRQLCRVELRSRGDVAGRSRTCGAPRFRRPLYRAELRPHAMGEAGLEPAISCV
jgi:hypothetical protein